MSTHTYTFDARHFISVVFLKPQYFFGKSNAVFYLEAHVSADVSLIVQILKIVAEGEASNGQSRKDLFMQIESVLNFLVLLMCSQKAPLS